MVSSVLWYSAMVSTMVSPIPRWDRDPGPTSSYAKTQNWSIFSTTTQIQYHSLFRTTFQVKTASHMSESINRFTTKAVNMQKPSSLICSASQWTGPYMITTTEKLPQTKALRSVWNYSTALIPAACVKWFTVSKQVNVLVSTRHERYLRTDNSIGKHYYVNFIADLVLAFGAINRKVVFVSMSTFVYNFGKFV